MLKWLISTECRSILFINLRKTKGYNFTADPAATRGGDFKNGKEGNFFGCYEVSQ